MRLFLSALDFCDPLINGAATADTGELACCRVKRGCVTNFTIAAVAVPFGYKQNCQLAPFGKLCDEFRQNVMAPLEKRWVSVSSRRRRRLRRKREIVMRSSVGLIMA